MKATRQTRDPRARPVKPERLLHARFAVHDGFDPEQFELAGGLRLEVRLDRHDIVHVIVKRTAPDRMAAIP